MPERHPEDPILTKVHEASVALARAKKDYLVAVLWAKSRGYSNVQIARAARKTEAAIRMYLKRKYQDQ